MDELFSQIANLGFPIAVTGYLLVRIETKLSELNDTIHELSASIRAMK